MDEQCPEREKLLREYTQCGRRLANLLGEQLAALNADRNATTFDQEIVMPKRAELEACRAPIIATWTATIASEKAGARAVAREGLELEEVLSLMRAKP